MKRIFGFRLVAGFFDVILGFLLCYILHWFLGHYFAMRSVVTFHIGQPGTWWKGLLPWFLGLIGTYFYTLPLALFIIFLPEAIWGWSLGKLILRIGIKDKDGLSASPKCLWLRFVFKTSLFWGIALALVLGSWELVAVSIIGGSIILLTGLPGRLTGTIVVRV